MADMGAFRDAVTAWAAGGPGEPARDPAARPAVRAVVLLEGPPTGLPPHSAACWAN